MPGPLESVTYRMHIAAIAMNAADAVVHCPPLPATRPKIRSTAPVQMLNARSTRFLTKASRPGARDAPPFRHSGDHGLADRKGAAESESREAAKRADDCH